MLIGGRVVKDSLLLETHKIRNRNMEEKLEIVKYSQPANRNTEKQNKKNLVYELGIQPNE